MRLIILSPGKIREKWLQAGIDEYVKRLRRFAQVEFQIVEDVPDSWPATKAIDEEGRRLLARLNQGGSQVVFVIGGSNGLAPSVLERAQERLCLSRLTFTHQMARLILLEQCYRAFKIAAGEAYHK